jgi:hypothetical protein
MLITKFDCSSKYKNLKLRKEGEVSRAEGSELKGLACHVSGPVPGPVPGP